MYFRIGKEEVVYEYSQSRQIFNNYFERNTPCNVAIQVLVRAI
jgi:hypothetical protein